MVGAGALRASIADNLCEMEIILFTMELSRTLSGLGSGEGEEEDDELLALLDELEFCDGEDWAGVDGFLLFTGRFVLFFFAVVFRFVCALFCVALCFFPRLFFVGAFFFAGALRAVFDCRMSPMTARVGGTPKLGLLLRLRRVLGISKEPVSVELPTLTQVDRQKTK